MEAKITKKIFHVITTIERGGAENQLLELARQQVNHGLVVKIFYLKGDPELASAFNESGISVEHKLSGRNVLVQIFLLRRVINEFESIVHAHLPRAELVSALARKKARFIFSRHNAEPYYPGAPRFVCILLSRFVAMRAVACVAISYAVRDFLIQQRELSLRFPIEVVHYGFTSSRKVQSSRSIKPSGSSIKLITVGRMVKQKNQEILIRIMKELTLNEVSFHLDIVGEGPLRPHLESLSQSLGLSKLVTFHGKVNNPRELLERADIFILSSIYEGFGFVLLEAMDCALPIIAARNSAIPEVIGNSGLMYETHSQQDLIEKVLFLKDSESRNKFAALSVDRVANFSSKIMYEKMALIYKRIYQSEKKAR